MSWSEEILHLIQPATENSFADYLSSLSNENQKLWEHSNLKEEQGLEIWMTQIAQHGRNAYVTAAVAAARYAYPIVIAAAGDLAMECGLDEKSPSEDGESEGMKIRRVEQWLRNSSKLNFDLVKESIDPSRQLEVWEEDLYPDEESMWWWFTAVGQLCANAVVHKEKIPAKRSDSSYDWSAPVCATRCVIAALKAIRKVDGDVAADVNALGKAIAKGFK